MRKQLIFCCIAIFIFVFFSAFAIRITDDVKGKKTEFRFVCQVDSGNIPCDFCLGEIYQGSELVGDINQTEEGIVFDVITYDGTFPNSYNLFMNFIVDGAKIDCSMDFYPSRNSGNKEWKGDVSLTIRKHDNEWEIVPICTNCKSVELMNCTSYHEGAGATFNVYQ